MIESRIVEQPVERARGSCLGIVAAIDQPPDARVNHGTRTHRARLHGHIELCIDQAPAPQRGCRGPQGDDLGVSGGVVQTFALVVCHGDHLTADHDHGAYWHLA